MISCKQFREYIIKPSLEPIGLYSVDVEELLIATMAHESKGGTYIHQVNGPAMGPYQMEPETHDDIWKSEKWMSFYHKSISANDKGLSKHSPYQAQANFMMYDLQYATIMARAFYFRAPEPIPEAHDIEAIWKLYKQRWNTTMGVATRNEFLANYWTYIKT